MRYIKKILVVFTLIAFSSCEDELDISNPNQPTADLFYNTEEDAIQSVNSIYSRHASAGISRFLPWLGTLRTEEMISQSPNNAIINNYDRFIINDYNFGEFYNIWNQLYVMIYRANQALDNIPDIEMDEELKQRLLGEAHFLRGWAYYQLGTYWGNVPLMLETSSPTDRPETSSQEEVYAQVIGDLEIATESLPTKDEYAPEDLGRATKGAAHAMLGKTFMQQQRYEDALQALEWLVEGEGASIYGLVNNYRENFLATTENNIESVYELQFGENELDTHQNDVNPNADQFNYGTSMAPFMAPRPIGFSDLEMNRWVLGQFEETEEGERDPRIEASFLYDSTDVRGPEHTLVYGERWIDRYPNIDGNEHQRAHNRKFLNDAIQDEENFRSPNNYRYIRYADVLLMYAESLNAVGRTSEAYEYVNRVRERADLLSLEEAHSEIGNNSDLFLEQLKQERLTELAGEGHRWADLARWEDLTPELSDRDPGFENFEVGKHELLPIPQQDIDFNPNLSQNPGW